MLVLSKEEYRSQIQALSTTDRPTSPEFLGSMLIIGAPVLVGYWVYELVLPVIWYIFYFSGLLFQYYLILKVKAHPRRSAYWRIITLNLTVALVYVSLPIVLWQSGETVFRVAAVSLSVRAMLNSMSHRARLPHLALGDAVANCVFLAFVVWDFLWDQYSFATNIALVFMVSSMGFYYVSALSNIFRVRASLRDATWRSVESQKMQAVGQLTGGVAHDFNNILTVVLGNLELYNEVETQAEKDQLAQDAYNAACRASVLTSQLLSFSRRATLVPVDIELHSVVHNFWSMAGRIMDKNIDFQADLPQHLPLIRVDRTQFEAALLNLIINARDAMPQGGQIRIFADVMNVSASQSLSGEYGLTAGKYIRIMISDTGHGIPSYAKNHVFDPFFTTKSVGQGSGLGLSMAKGFAEQSGGTLYLESFEEVGTIVTILLPAFAAEGDVVEDKIGAPLNHWAAPVG